MTRERSGLAACSGWRSNQCSTTCRILGSTIKNNNIVQQKWTIVSFHLHIFMLLCTKTSFLDKNNK